jgi:hypothetical protein
MSTHRVIRSWYDFDDASINAFMPIGFGVMLRIRRRPARNSWPWT